MKRNLLLPLFLISIALWLANCNQAGPCTGSLTLENPIPDITVAVGDTVLIDLTNPPVFVNTEGVVSYSLDQLSGYLNAHINRIENSEDNGRLSTLRIIGVEIGEVMLRLQASSDCLENSTNININITES